MGSFGFNRDQKTFTLLIVTNLDFAALSF